MTEAEWRTSEDAIGMLDYLKKKAVATPRKLCLFTCASLRRLFADKQLILDLLDVADRSVECSAADEERRSAVARLEATQNLSSLPIILVRHCLTFSLTGYDAAMEWGHNAMATAACCKAEPQAAVCTHALLHDIFLTPLARRVPRISPAWRTGNVVALAHTIYTERAFDRLPILADALEDAGCTNADILEHCRGGGEHVRGCWVVDLVLGKQ
jgi:hypothetical protein